MLMNDKIMFDRYHCINKLYVTLRSQLPGKPVPDGLQERPSLGPLGLCVRGVCIRSPFLKCHACTYARFGPQSSTHNLARALRDAW